MASGSTPLPSVHAVQRLLALLSLLLAGCGNGDHNDEAPYGPGPMAPTEPEESAQIVPSESE